MPRVPRTRERTATQAELADDRRRHQATKPHLFSGAQKPESTREDPQPKEAREALRATYGRNGRPALLAVRQ
jgi:hypothetical protein